jgi:enoyl-CoA hydratase
MTDPATAPVTVTRTDDGVTHIAIDDGKANALSPQALGLIEAGLDTAEDGGRAVLISGRPGRFSAGFDLSVMQEGPESARKLVTRGAELALRIYELPQPVVVACTGHALAMGAILLLAADLRIGAEGEFKIGLNEVAIGMPVPIFATELARDRLSPRHFLRAVNHAGVYSPTEAVEVGYLDAVAAPDDVIAVARTHAADLGERLNPIAFAATRTNVHAATAEHIRETLDADLATFSISS